MTDPKPEAAVAFYDESTGERVSDVYPTKAEAHRRFWRTGAVLRPVLITPVNITPDPESEK